MADIRACVNLPHSFFSDYAIRGQQLAGKQVRRQSIPVFVLTNKYPVPPRRPRKKGLSSVGQAYFCGRIQAPGVMIPEWTKAPRHAC